MKKDPPADKQKIAVALKYSPEERAAPHILASGRGAIAENILNQAFAHDVKVREDADLAQLLSVLDIGQDIPPAAYHAVAEILSYIYQLNQKLTPNS